MARATTLILLILTVMFCGGFFEGLVFGQGQSINVPVLLVVQQDAEVYEGTGAKVLAKKLRSGTALIGLRPQGFGDPVQPGWEVVSPDDASFRGWVRGSYVSTIDFRIKELQATAISLRAGSSGKKQSLPELISLQNSPATKRAWLEVSDAISENEALPEDERLPEPYFARAEIWASAKNYSDSLQDYLTAIKYARKSNRDILTYSEYFDRLYDVAEKLQNIPVPAQGGEILPQIAARAHFDQGYRSFFGGQLVEAVDRFDSAVQLAPDQPLYWYFRALTHKRLGDEPRAQHDALMGASFERQLVSFRRLDLNKDLTRVQGSMRTWLETFRLGSPTGRLLRKYAVGVDATMSNK